MKKLNQISVAVLFAALFLSACAPDRQVVSDEERLNIMCSTKKKDRDEKCLSDEVSMDYRDMSVVLAQKINREAVLQSKILIQNNKAVVSAMTTNSTTQMTDQKIQDRRAVSWNLEYVGIQDDATGFQKASRFSGRTMSKDLGAGSPDAQTFDHAVVFGDLNNAISDLLNWSRVDAKERARPLGVFSFVEEQLSYSLTAPLENTKLKVAWAGQAQTAYSKFDKNSKHFFSKDQVVENGLVEMSLTESQDIVVEKMNLIWNVSPRKDAVLNYSVESLGAMKLVEIDGGCLRLVGEFTLTNTNDGVKKKPLKTFTSKLVLTETELNLYGTNKDGSLNLAKPAKTMPIPNCSEYNGVMVDYGRVL